MIPRLKIVPVSSIIPLMEYDEDKAVYIKELVENSGSIGTPVSLTSLGDKKYLLIDNCEIIEVARRLDIRFLPAQVTSAVSSIRIDSKIYAEQFDRTLISNFLGIFPRVANLSFSKRGNKNRAGWLRFFISPTNGDNLSVYFKRYFRTEFPSSVFNFLEYIGHHCRLTRRIYTNSIRTANTRRPDDYTLIELHGLSFDDLLSSTQSYHLFPPGFLRFEYGNRIVGIDFPIRILNERVTVREKERFLHDLVNFRLNSGHPEFIGGGVYMLNYLTKK